MIFFYKIHARLFYQITHVNTLRTDALPLNNIFLNHQNKQKRSVVVETLVFKNTSSFRHFT